MLFAAFAVVSIIFPNVWNRIATLVGVGRGTDVVLYALVVAFLSFAGTTYLRFRDMETRYTRLARRIALDDAQPPHRKPRPAPEPVKGSPAEASQCRSPASGTGVTHHARSRL